MSYNGGVRLSATIDKKIIPTQEHADLLSQCINEELMNLRTSASSYGEENMVQNEIKVNCCNKLC